MSLRDWLYAAARFLGDVEAVRRGRVAQRLARRAAGRFTAGLLARMFR